MTDVIRIANCSGFYGDRLDAAREMVEGGPIDVLTGDYLAELTMTILYNQRSKKPDAGYVGTFLKQVKDVLATCMEKNIKMIGAMLEKMESLIFLITVTIKVKI